MHRFTFEAGPVANRRPHLPAVGGESGIDYRPAVCRWENDLFERHPQALRLLEEQAARTLIRRIFADVELPAPRLAIVSGFSDPDIGGYADVVRNVIFIEEGFLHVYLILHEIAHVLVPEDRLHGAAFIHVAKALYGAHLDIPEADLVALMRRHRLPELSAARN
jgi:hypothetical protein